MLPTLQAILIGVGVFFLPGYALLALVNPKIDTDPVERFSLGVGLSLAVIPLSLYLSTLVGLQQGPEYLTIFLILAGIVTIWDLYRRWRANGLNPLRQHWATIVVFAIIACAALIARLQGVASIEYPLWTDSYHHTLIAQIIADTGQVPSSYEPYAPIRDFTYHFGFHALVAWFHWLTRIPVPRSVVVVGQVVNALVVPTTYVLAIRLWKKPFIGLVAGLVIGLLAHMPAFFVNWGRYTQLTGQMLLPIASALTISAVLSDKFHVRLSLLAAVAAAGLFIAHNRITIFFGLFLFTHIILQAIDAFQKKSSIRWLLINAGVITSMAILIDAVWIWRFFSGFGGIIANQLLQVHDAAVHGRYFDWNIEQFLEFGMSLHWWTAAGASLLLGLFKKDKGTMLLALSSLLIFLGANTDYLGMTPLYSMRIVMIWTYLPVGLMIGFGFYWVVEWGVDRLNVVKQNASLQYATVILSLALLAPFGISKISELTLPENGFVHAADLRAMEWIENNLSSEVLFYIKPQYWTRIGAHGLDGGYWIPYFTRRDTVIPPQTYPADGTREYVSFINTRLGDLMEEKTPQGFWLDAIEYGVTHIYIGKRETNIDPGFFLSDPSHFQLQYKRDGVWIIEVIKTEF